jgi:hypothetical protein
MATNNSYWQMSEGYQCAENPPAFERYHSHGRPSPHENLNVVKIGPGPAVRGLFEVTPAKKCSMGCYMTQSGPNHDLCCGKNGMWNTKKGRAEIAKYTCLNGACGEADGMIPHGAPLRGQPLPGNPWGVGQYTGTPLHFQRTPMSNHLWKNEMCNPPILQKNHPSVL